MPLPTHPFGQPRTAAVKSKYYPHNPSQDMGLVQPPRRMGDAMTAPAQPHAALPSTGHRDFMRNMNLTLSPGAPTMQPVLMGHLHGPSGSFDEFGTYTPRAPIMAPSTTAPVHANQSSVHHRYQLHDAGYTAPGVQKASRPRGHSGSFPEPPRMVDVRDGRSHGPQSHALPDSLQPPRGPVVTPRAPVPTHSYPPPGPYPYVPEETGQVVYPSRTQASRRHSHSSTTPLRPRAPGFNLPAEAKDRRAGGGRRPFIRFARRSERHSGLDLMDALTGAPMQDSDAYFVREMHGNERREISLMVTVSCPAL